jgi:hypothetical protein
MPNESRRVRSSHRQAHQAVGLVACRRAPDAIQRLYLPNTAVAPISTMMMPITVVVPRVC